MHIKPKFFLLLYFVVLIQPVFSQNKIISVLKRCPVKTINFELGLANNGTTNIITDALGFTWISTKTALQRYNGYSLETINPVINKKTITINATVYFFALQNGLVWISYGQGILEYNCKLNSFKQIIYLPGINNLNFLILPFKEDSAGVWCIQYKKGIVLYSKKGKQVKELPNTNDYFIQNIFNNEVLNNTFFAANQNSVFINDGKSQIKQINLETGAVAYKHAENVFSFACNNTSLFVVAPSGLSCIDLNNAVIKKNIPLKDIISENLFSGCCFINNNNQLLIGLNSHLFEFDTACNYQKEFTDLNRNRLLAQGFIRNVYEDNFKRIWLLTNDDIKRIQDFDIPFEHFIYANEKNNFVRSIYYDEQKHVLLAGCYNGGIQLYDTSGNALWQHAITSETIKDINAIEKISADNYLIETIGRGWYVLHLSSKQLTPLILNKSVENKINTHAIAFSNNTQRINDSIIFIATNYNVFKCIFNKAQLKSVQPLLPSVMQTSEQLTSFYYALNKSLWVGTNDGLLYKINVNSQLQIVHIPQNFLVRTLTEDAQHNIWIGTDKGLYVYNSAGILIKSFTTQSGLLNDCIYALLPVNNKPAVFASSNLGLSYVSLNENIINYTKESGLQENEFNTASAVKTQNGKYYFGGVNGITAFYPSALFNIKDAPLLNITKLIINDSVYNNYSPVYKHDSVFLNYNQNHIEFNFAATGLLNTNEYIYKYRLKNFEKNWQTTHEPTGIKYVLPPGNYMFEISCHPIYAPANNFTKSIFIIVSAPWWQSWWFNSLVILMAIALIVFIAFQYNRRKYIQQIRALELQHKIQEERHRISRDLHDNLGAYAAAIAANVSNIQQAKNENVFHQLKENSQAIINQLNDTIWALNKESVSLTAISDRFKVFLQKLKPNYANINISINEEIHNDIQLLPVNALHLFRIMQEAVNNALRHSGCKNVFMQILSNDAWQIIIKDDGSGVHNIDEKTAQGNGLKNMKLRAAEAGWKIEWINSAPSGTELIISSTIN